MRVAVVWMSLIAALLPFPSGGADVPTSQIPCTDPRGCPDLVVDAVRFAVGTQRTESFSAGSCDVQEGMIQSGARQVLRFTFNTPNIGAGDLRVGSPSAHPEWFVFHPCHNHYHFRWYADYRLWTPDGWVAWEEARNAEPGSTASEVLANHPELASEFVAGNKAGFCVIDIVPGAPTPHGWAPPDVTGLYFSCGNQGISRGWADEYIFTLSGQYVDVTNVPTGAYILESEVNAERLYEESEYANNRAALPVVVT